MRRKTDMMKKRQLVDEAKLKGMEEKSNVIIYISCQFNIQMFQQEA